MNFELEADFAAMTVFERRRLAARLLLMNVDGSADEAALIEEVRGCFPGTFASPARPELLAELKERSQEFTRGEWTSIDDMESKLQLRETACSA